MVKLKRTALYDAHRQANAKFVEFAGWEMPVHYGSILDEARRVRAGCGMFDVSHMGRVLVSGEQAADDLDRLATMDVAGLAIGQVRYGFLCHEKGGVIDDITVARMSDNEFLVVVNAARREADITWMQAHLSPGIHLSDLTLETAMIAGQGPDALSIVDELVEDAEKPSSLKPFRLGRFSLLGVPCQISRTGYTGEDGAEIICPADAAERIWKALHGKGMPPCGLGARDILRLEAGFCLYGHDLTEDITPAEADLMRFVAMGKLFIGREAIAAQLASDLQRKRVGLRLDTRATAREGAKVLGDGQPVGFVTSGVFSPHLNTAIAMAYVAVEWAAAGKQVQVLVRETLHGAEVVKMPFLRLPSKKPSR